MQLLVFYLIVGFIVYYVLYRIMDIIIYSKHVGIVDKNPFYYDFSKILGVMVLIITLGTYSNREYEPMTIELTSGEVVRGSFRINVYNNYETANGEEYFRGAIKKTTIDEKR